MKPGNAARYLAADWVARKAGEWADKVIVF